MYNLTTLTFLDAKKDIPRPTWKPIITKSTKVNSFSGSFMVLVQLASYVSLLALRKLSKLPCGANSMITIRRFPFVQAPRRLIMFLCCPRWMSILSSEAKSLYAASVAPSTTRNKTYYKQCCVNIKKVKIIFLQFNCKPFKVLTATGTSPFFHPEPPPSFFRSFATEDRRIFERRLKDSALLSRGFSAKIPMASASTTCPKAPAPSTFPRMSLSSGNSQSGS